jgi:hypothetical protein
MPNDPTQWMSLSPTRRVVRHQGSSRVQGGGRRAPPRHPLGPLQLPGAAGHRPPEAGGADGARHVELHRPLCLQLRLRAVEGGMRLVPAPGREPRRPPRRHRHRMAAQALGVRARAADGRDAQRLDHHARPPEPACALPDPPDPQRHRHRGLPASRSGALSLAARDRAGSQGAHVARGAPGSGPPRGPSEGRRSPAGDAPAPARIAPPRRAAAPRRQERRARTASAWRRTPVCRR